MSRIVYFDCNGNEIDMPKSDVIKKTNAERIRSMTDEELSVFIAEQAGCEWCIARVGDDCDQCPKAWLDWLKQEAEEGE